MCVVPVVLTKRMRKDKHMREQACFRWMCDHYLIRTYSSSERHGDSPALVGCGHFSVRACSMNQGVVNLNTDILPLPGMNSDGEPVTHLENKRKHWGASYALESTYYTPLECLSTQL